MAPTGHDMANLDVYVWCFILLYFLLHVWRNHYILYLKTKSWCYF